MLKNNFINDLLIKSLGDDFDINKLQIEFPPNIELGDFTVNCFSLAKELKKNPSAIASELAEKLTRDKLFESVEATGAYVNIKIKGELLFKNVLLNDILTINTKQKVMVEYLQPNTNKPLHLGHLRNGCLGMSISNILHVNGDEVIKANLINDRGIHICKSMLAWKKWGNDETPESTKMKGDHFVGKWYVRYSKEVEKQPELENEVRELLKKWEEGDEETLKLWNIMNSWVFEGFKETNKNYGFDFDKEYFESQTYKTGIAIIEEGLEKKIFYKDEDGGIVVDLPAKEFGLDQNGKLKKVTLQRADGTSLYMTQDLGTAKLKFEQYQMDKSIYIVGSEQEYHFKCLFAILEMLDYDFAKKSYHLSYGMVYLPDGKMKSREGKVVDADDLLEEMENLAKEEIKKRMGNYKLEIDEINIRARKIGLGAIKFYLLKTNPHNDIYFNPKESISFDGFTGPYCQYTYARATKIIEKSEINIEKITNIDWELLGNDEEREIAQKIINLQNQIVVAGNELNPSKVAIAIYELAGAFNQFYQKHPVINAKNDDLTKARLGLTESTRKNIQAGLKLLNIDTLDSM